MSIASLPSLLPSATLPAESAIELPAHRWRILTGWLAVGVGFSIPVSTSLAEIVVSLFCLTAILVHRPSLMFTLRGVGGSLAVAVGLFAFLALGLVWTTVELKDGVRCLLKYREFLYLPLLTSVFSDPRWRRPAVWSYLAGCGTLLALSYGEWLTAFDMGLSQQQFPNDHVISKDRIIHNLLMSFFAYLCALEFQRGTGWARWLLIALIAAAVFNIVFLVQGRTGYVAFAALLALWLYGLLGRRGWLVALLLLGMGATTACSVSPLVRSRFLLTWNQFQNQFGQQVRHSDDPRLEFYVNTLRLIGKHPILGTGTGSFQREYDALIAGTELLPVSEPHNEFLLLSVQLGLLGGIGYALLFALQWRAGGMLPPWERQMMHGIVLTIALGSLFNSLILSVTGGLLWSYFAALAGGAMWNTPHETSPAQPL